MATAQCPASNSCASAGSTVTWQNTGTGRTASFYGNTTDSAVYVLNTATGNAMYLYSNNPNGGTALNVGSIGGPAILASTAATPAQGWPAITGQANGTDGVSGTSNSSNGVRGRSYSGASGVYGENFSGGTGVAGRTNPTGVAVFGDNNASSGGWAGYFTGRVAVLGWLQKSGGGFTIDHPLDPTNKILSHSFVESPDMKNFYDGVIELDSHGEAWVELPEWFSVLNRDFRYQLTPIGGPANLFVAEEISANRFKVAGGKPHQRASWAVTGVRQDAWAEKNRMKVEQFKPEDERGTYLTPEAFDQPVSKGVVTAKFRATNRATRPAK